MLGLRLLDKAQQKREADAQAAASAHGPEGFLITGEGDPQVDALVLERAKAKKAKDFARADALREQLGRMGIEVTDTKQGAIWKRIG